MKNQRILAISLLVWSVIFFLGWLYIRYESTKVLAIPYVRENRDFYSELFQTYWWTRKFLFCSTLIFLNAGFVAWFYNRRAV